MKKLVAITISILLAGCGSKLSGTYSATIAGDAKMAYEFQSSGKVFIDNGFGMKTEMPYEVDGKHVKLVTPQGNAILTIIDDKTIEGPMGIKLIKQS